MNKYHARKTTVYGQVFDSKREAEEYLVLKDRLKRREIDYLERQKRFEILPAFCTLDGKSIRAVHYTPDFFVRYPDGKEEAIEVKGVRTRDYILRMKMFQYQYPTIHFVEVR